VAFAVFLNPRSQLAPSKSPNVQHHPIMATPSPAKLEAAKNKKRFIGVFPDVVEELLDTVRVESMPAEVVEWYRRVCGFAD
jgi:hypothetical protein